MTMNRSKVGITSIVIWCYFQIIIEVKSSEIQFSRKLQGHNIKTIAPSLLSSCILECQHKVKCKSINYNRMEKICELSSMSGNDSPQLQAAPGWVFSDRNKWLSNNSSQCKSNSCSENETCVEKVSGFECKVEECPVEVENENGIVFGNMNNVGSVLATKCDLGFNYFACDKTGEWISLDNKQCVSLCSPPDDHELLDFKEAYIKTAAGVLYITPSNASFVLSAMIMQGSNISYQCRTDNHTISASNCAAGTWSAPELSCLDQCELGQSYSYSLYKCVSLESCVNGYVNTLQKFNSTLYRQHNFKIIRNVTENECQVTCLSDQLCNSFEYCPTSKQCNTQRLQGVDNSSFYTRYSCLYYQRNCY